MVFCPVGTLTISGDILMSQLGLGERVDVASINGIEARDAAKHAPVPRTTPNTKNQLLKVRTM